jgi:hypothetical protein
MTHPPQPDPQTTVTALARHFQMYEEARNVIGRMDAAERATALKRGLRSDADLRSVIIAALIFSHNTLCSA